MNVLLDKMVARKCNPVLPRSHEVFGRLRIDWFGPEHVPDAERNSAGIKFAERLFDGHRLVRPDMVPVVAHFRAGNNYQPFLFRLPPGGDYSPAARRIHGHGFFDKDVLTGLNRRFKVQRPKQRRRCHKHDLSIGLKQVPIAARTAEATLWWNV